MKPTDPSVTASVPASPYRPWFCARDKTDEDWTWGGDSIEEAVSVGKEHWAAHEPDGGFWVAPAHKSVGEDDSPEHDYTVETERAVWIEDKPASSPSVPAVPGLEAVKAATDWLTQGRFTPATIEDLARIIESAYAPLRAERDAFLTALLKIEDLGKQPYNYRDRMVSVAYNALKAVRSTEGSQGLSNVVHQPSESDAPLLLELREKSLADDCLIQEAIKGAGIMHAQQTALERERDEAAHSFKNFHSNLCRRFGYGHDEVDWRRDQCSLEEHIANQIKSLTTRAESAEKELSTWDRFVTLESLRQSREDLGWLRRENEELRDSLTACFKDLESYHYTASRLMANQLKIKPSDIPEPSSITNARKVLNAPDETPRP